tara:strand:- start:741 stop:1004 length:264 start_codon:yes stop_codon:yes gene_type:complete
MIKIMKKNIEIKYAGNNIKIVYTIPKKESYMPHHIAVYVENNKPIPLTKTGYRSHFVNLEKEQVLTDKEIINWFHKENGYVPQMTLF